MVFNGESIPDLLYSLNLEGGPSIWTDSTTLRQPLSTNKRQHYNENLNTHISNQNRIVYSTLDR